MAAPLGAERWVVLGAGLARQLARRWELAGWLATGMASDVEPVSARRTGPRWTARAKVLWTV